jgi:hypothetical protein
MLTEIEDAIVELIESKMSATAGMVDVQKGFQGLIKPAVYISTEAATFEKVTQVTFRQTVTVYVDIVFSHLMDERERRKGVYLIMEGVVQLLLLQDLGLDIKPLIPKSWRNATSEELRKKGLIAFTLELGTSYTISKLDEEATDDLLSIGLNYYLKPGDDIVDASDVITTV